MLFVTPPKKASASHCDPVRQALRQARGREGVGRGAEHRDEDLRLVDLAGLAIDDLDRLAGIVGLHHRAGLVPVAPARMRAALEDPEGITEPGIAVGMRGSVFLPEQAQRHALALQLGRHRRPVRLARVPRPIRRNSNCSSAASSR